MEYSFNKSKDGGFTLGLHKRGAFDEIFNLNECHISGEIDGIGCGSDHQNGDANKAPIGKGQRMSVERQVQPTG